MEFDIEKAVIATIKKFIDVLREEKISVEKTILYGSRIDGNTRNESDIDVAVISKDFGKDIIEEGMRLFRLAGKVDSRIEPVPLSLMSYRGRHMDSTYI